MFGGRTSLIVNIFQPKLIFRGSQAYKYTSIRGIFSGYDHQGPAGTISSRHTGLKPGEIGSKAILPWSRLYDFPVVLEVDFSDA